MKTRQEKKRDKERRQQKYRERRWQQYARILDAIGLGDGFRMLKERTKNLLCSFGLPLPEINCDSVNPITHQVKSEILDRLRESEVEVCGTKMSWAEVYCVLAPLVTVLQDAIIDTGRPFHPDLQFLYRAQRVCAKQYDGIIDGTLRVLADVLTRAVANASEFDLRIAWFSLDNPVLTGPTRRSHRITIKAEPPQRINAALDGSVRAAYRCGGDVSGGFRWMNWPANLFGEPHEQAFAVYIQKHALERLHQRLQPFDHASVHISLRMSLNNPAIIRCEQGGTYFVEYRLAGQARVGYLVARRLSDKIVITTFLFLTMQGTPEAQRLAKELRLHRPDIEYNRLDSLSGFLNTDLSKDAELAHVFEEVGCGDLLRLSCDDASSSPLQAAALRQYLQLPASKSHKQAAGPCAERVRMKLINLTPDPKHLTDQSPACHTPAMLPPELHGFSG